MGDELGELLCVCVLGVCAEWMLVELCVLCVLLLTVRVEGRV